MGILGIVACVAFAGGCSESHGRPAGAFGPSPGGKADDNDDIPGSELLDADFIVMLDQAASHLGDEEDWDSAVDDTPDDGGSDDGGSDDGMPDDDMPDDGGGTDDGDVPDDGGGTDGGMPEGDGGGTDDGGDPSGGGGPSCEGQCGSDEDQGGCFCDPVCVEIDDCCLGYQRVCEGGGAGDAPGSDPMQPPDLERFALGDGERARGAASVADPTDDLMQELDPSQFSKACLEIIDGDVDVAKIIDAAGRDAKKYGGRCFVAAVYATGTTGGALAPASVVCVAATAGGGALGAAKSYIKQKRSDIALCTAQSIDNVVSAVLDAIQWLGWFEMASKAQPDAKPEVPIEGLGDPDLECVGPYSETNYHHDDGCGKIEDPTPECYELDDWDPTYCTQVRETAQRWARCRWGRIVATNTRWGGNPNKGHRTAILRATSNQEECLTLMKELCDEPWSFADEAQLKQEGKDLICD